MKPVLHIDFETRSYEELGGSKSVGLHNYCLAESTSVLMLAWAIGDGEVELWEPHLGPMPDRLLNLLNDTSVQLTAFNSAFERNILQYKLSITIPASRFIDPQVYARYLSLPGNLEDVGEILRLPKELAKDKRGEQLIDLFSYPVVKRKKGVETKYFNDWASHSDDWKLFGEYCKQDVRAEREILRRQEMLTVYPLPPTEQKLWLLDQKINDVGIPTDVKFVSNMLELGTRAKNEVITEQNKTTGLENSNSNTQMLEWCRTNGYAKQSLGKNTVNSELKFNTNLTEVCRDVLTKRKVASSTSYKKMAALLRLVSPDSRLRNQFVFLGSSRCGRWSGSGYQFHNQARPSQEFEDDTNLNDARCLIYAKDYEGLIKRFGKHEKDHGSVLSTVKSCIRTSFVAPTDKRFNIADLNAIETRGAGYVAQCQTLLDVFNKGRDPYLDFGVKLTGLPYEKLAADIKSKDPVIKAATKGIRQDSKVGVLACVYRIGGGGIVTNEDGDQVKTGLWAYAEAAGNDMSQDRAHEIVRIYRDSYPEIVKCWYDLEDAVKDVLKEGTVRVKRYLGPNNCIMIDKLTVKDRYPVMRIHLPSGRILHYMDARIEDCAMPWRDQDDNEVFKATLVYSGQNQKTKKWTSITSHGGKLFENIVQGLSRDILAEKMLLAEEAGLNLVAHVHDEAISETDDDAFSPDWTDIQNIMNREVAWAPGFPLGSDGFSGSYYHK